MVRKVFAFVLSIFTTITGFFGMFSGYKTYSNLSYGDGPAQTFDIYVPHSAARNETNGIILFIHGGSWTSGDKSAHKTDCKTYAKKGYITATMNYTLINQAKPEATAFTMLDEIQMCIEAIHAFSGKHNLHIAHIATAGYSAGAHISYLYAYTRSAESPIPYAFTANRVGPSDFHPESWDSRYGQGMSVNLASMLSGKTITPEMVGTAEAEEIIRSISPAMLITKDSVPTIAAYGGKDSIVLAGNANATKTALEENGVPHDFILYPNSDHGLSSDPDSAKQYQKIFLSYCKTYFGY